MPNARFALILTLSTALAACASGPPPALPVAPAGEQPPAPPPTEAPARPALPEETPAVPRTEYFGGNASLDVSPGRTPPAIRHDTRRGIELGFVDADIRRVIDAILGETLQVNYSVDPEIQGAITLRTARPVARDSLIPALEVALATVNAAIIRRDNVYAVVPRSAAQTNVGLTRPLTAQERTLPGYALEIVPLNYASAKEAAKLVTTSGAKDAILQIDEVRNQLIIAGASQERAAIRRLVESVDVDWMRGMSFALYRLENVKPQELTRELERIFEPPLDLLDGRVRLVPIPRMKAILGVAARQTDLRQLEAWIRRLDVEMDQEKRRLYVYNVQNGRARDLAGSLRLVVGGTTMDGGDVSSSPTLTTTSANTATTSTSTQSTTGSLFSTRSEQPRVTRSASTVQDTPLPEMPLGNTLRIVPDENNNSLLLYATPAEYALIQDALKQIDILPRQVMIEAVLAEVTLNDDLRYGLQWAFTPGNNEITLSTSENGSVSSTFPGFSYVYTGWADARVVLNALQSKTDVRVLSSPKLVVLNNQTATLQVGDQVPIITQSSQAVSTPDAPVLNSIEMKDTGVILEVTPRANDNGLVVLDINQEVSEVAPTTTSGIDSPTIQQRKFSSTIASRSGSTIALGGLIRETQSRTDSGVPLLKNIPLIGNAFKNTTNNGRRTELIVLLTATVMRDARETEQSINELIEGFHAVRPLLETVGKAPPYAQP